jgi:hypothetical protein
MPGATGCGSGWRSLFRTIHRATNSCSNCFFGREAAPGVALMHVREVRRRNRRMLATLEGIEKMARENPSDNPNKPYWMLTLGLGLALTRAALDWGEPALAELSAIGSTPFVKE